MKKFSNIFIFLSLFLFTFISCNMFEYNDHHYRYIIYLANGGTFGDGTTQVQQRVEGGESVKLKTVAQLGLTRSGYKFKNWSGKYEDGEKVVVDIENYDGLWISANWELANQYTVTLDANGGTMKNSNGNYVSTLSYYGTEPSFTIPKKDSINLENGNYTFAGWMTSADGTSTDYTNGQKFTPSGDITLYARWSTNGKEEYTITFNPNGGTIETESKKFIA